MAYPKLPVREYGRILFHDAGFIPWLDGSTLELGPEQMALVGFGPYGTKDYDFGMMDDVQIPSATLSLAAEWKSDGERVIRSQVRLSHPGILRIVVQQFTPDGRVLRSTGGAPPDGTTLGNILTIRASQSGRDLDVKINYDKAIWSGLSWAVGEVNIQETKANIQIECATTEHEPLILKAELYLVVH
jgi:hypothetical protein